MDQPRKPPVKISILEKDEDEISHCWKYCQIFSYVMVIISGIASSLSMANVNNMFNHECILYADLAVTTENNWTIVITPHSGSRWGSFSHCSFTIYSPVASVIVAGIWGCLFVMCGRGGASSKNLPQPWRIIPPAILFNFIFLVLSCVSVALSFGGFAAFCGSITPQINATSCEELVNFVWERYPNAVNFYDDVILAQTGASFVLAGWTLGFIILLMRVLFHADFRIIGPITTTDRKPSSDIGGSSEGQGIDGNFRTTGTTSSSSLGRSIKSHSLSSSSSSNNNTSRTPSSPSSSSLPFPNEKRDSQKPLIPSSYDA